MHFIWRQTPLAPKQVLLSIFTNVKSKLKFQTIGPAPFFYTCGNKTWYPFDAFSFEPFPSHPSTVHGNRLKHTTRGGRRRGA